MMKIYEFDKLNLYLLTTICLSNYKLDEYNHLLKLIDKTTNTNFIFFYFISDVFFKLLKFIEEHILLKDIKNKEEIIYFINYKLEDLYSKNFLDYDCFNNSIYKKLIRYNLINFNKYISTLKFENKFDFFKEISDFIILIMRHFYVIVNEIDNRIIYLDLYEFHINTFLTKYKITNPFLFDFKEIKINDKIIFNSNYLKYRMKLLRTNKIESKIKNVNIYYNQKNEFVISGDENVNQ